MEMQRSGEENQICSSSYGLFLKLILEVILPYMYQTIRKQQKTIGSSLHTTTSIFNRIPYDWLS